MTQSRLRYPMLALAMIALLAGIWAGLLRLGWGWPLLQPALPVSHGPLMVSGFLGTLIAVERAVALRERWTYLGPALSGLGALLLVLGLQGIAGPLMITLGSLGLVLIFAVIVRRHPTQYMVLMGIGALSWLAGNILWVSGKPIFEIVLWWAGFLILTIAGERLELGRLLMHSQVTQTLLLGAAGIFLAGLIITIVSLDLGTRIASVGMLGLSLWLLRYDIARRTIFKEGLPRFVALCLLSGYVWLGAAGFMGLAFGGVVAGMRYDAFLHSIFLGFVFSMIFGHAPIIFPAITGVQVSFDPRYYAYLALLHLSLLTRISGDVMISQPLRLWGGLLNGIALLLFILFNAYSVVKARRMQATVKTPVVLKRYFPGK
ncbi:MAG TPA: hypothetical protein VE136_17425 [Anaerolineales bacterium]|nr:hypothetical protein [Anaerolineales bacterium]